MGSRIDHSASLRLLEYGIYLNHTPELKRSQMDSIDWLNCLGIKMDDFSVTLYNLPVSSRIDGILGMDFLISNRAIVATHEAEIYVPVQ